MAIWCMENSSRQSNGTLAQYVEQFLAKYDTPQVRQPPNSQDMVPYDFCIFPEWRTPWKVNDLKMWKRSNFNETQQQGMKGASSSSRAARKKNVWKQKGPTSKRISPSSRSVYYCYFVASVLILSDQARLRSRDISVGIVTAMEG